MLFRAPAIVLTATALFNVVSATIPRGQDTFIDEIPAVQLGDGEIVPLEKDGQFLAPPKPSIALATSVEKPRRKLMRDKRKKKKKKKSIAEPDCTPLGSVEPDTRRVLRDLENTGSSLSNQKVGQRALKKRSKDEASIKEPRKKKASKPVSSFTIFALTIHK